MRRILGNRIIVLAAVFFLVFLAVCCNYYKIAVQERTSAADFSVSEVTISAGESQGTIFDRNMLPLTNREYQLVAVAVPRAENLDQLRSIAAEPASFEVAVRRGIPFAFRCKHRLPESESLTFFEIPLRYDSSTALHTIGYLSENSGASGIEYGYDRILRSPGGENSVTYGTDGFGNILMGEGKQVVRSGLQLTGVVTTLDSEIQRICEAQDIKKGAVVVSDIVTGDILGMASYPSYDRSELGSALTDADSPLINRCLYSYSVGSVFKLVTACEAMNEGMEGFVMTCNGWADVFGQRFACHKFDGHGQQTMTEAMVNSCNPYFIELSKCLDVEQFRGLAFDLGFGRQTHLCAGMTASAGVLPTVEELLIPAELGNFAFGQGKLTATPLQINQLTCAIASGGRLPLLRLIRGVTLDGQTVANEKSARRSEVMTSETAAELRLMMTKAVYSNPGSNAAPRYVRAGAKTSTAQTGRFDQEGNELCNGWITGFFPCNTPHYAVTVLCEDGGYGNDCAAPVFRDIADGIMTLGKG